MEPARHVHRSGCSAPQRPRCDADKLREASMAPSTMIYSAMGDPAGNSCRSKSSTDAQIKVALTDVRRQSARPSIDSGLQKALDDARNHLRMVLTIRQEATLVTVGILQLTPRAPAVTVHALHLLVVCSIIQPDSVGRIQHPAAHPPAYLEIDQECGHAAIFSSEPHFRQGAPHVRPRCRPRKLPLVVKIHRAGRLQEAERGYEEILARRPDHAPAARTSWACSPARRSVRTRRHPEFFTRACHHCRARQSRVPE